MAFTLSCLHLKAPAILAIPLDEPERLFKLREAIKKDYRALVKLWHPDKNKSEDAEKVFLHIQALYDNAQEKAIKGTWNPVGMVELRGRNTKFVRIIYRAKRPFELGTMYIGNRLVAFVIDRKHEDLVIKGLRAIGTIRYPNEEFRQSLEQYFPKVEHYLDAEDYIVICLRKDENEVLLSDLLKHFGGKMDPKHMAWSVSRLFNLLAFLQICEMSHNGLTLDTVFVSPKRHTASLYGGWWYAREFGETLNILPPEVFKLAPRSLIATKNASAFLDLECVRAIGRSLLGDPAGNGLRMNKDVPPPMTNFLMLPSSNDALKDYEAWYQVLRDCYGPRKFTEMKVDIDHIYPKEN